MINNEIKKMINNGKIKVSHCIMCNNVFGTYKDKIYFQMKKKDFISIVGEDITTSIAGCSLNCYEKSLIYMFGKGTNNIKDVPKHYHKKLKYYINNWQPPVWEKNINNN